MKLLESMSVREKGLWAELLMDLIVAIYYFPRAISIMLQGDGLSQGRAMTELVVSTVVLAIVVSIIVFGFVYRQRDAEQKDERDYRFEASGNLVGFCTLNLLLALVLAHIVIAEYSTPAGAGSFLVQLGALGIGHLILLAMVLASITKAATQLFRYRRSY